MQYTKQGKFNVCLVNDQIDKESKYIVQLELNDSSQLSCIWDPCIELDLLCSFP